MLKRAAPIRRMTPTAQLLAAWDRLPARERLMLALLFYEGLTPTEIAVAIGCSAREVTRVVERRLRLFRIRARRTAVDRRASTRSTPAFGTRRRAA